MEQNIEEQDTYALKGKYAVVEKLINNEYKKGIIEIK